MENLKEIVKGTHARMTHVCNGKVIYQLEIDSTTTEWETIYLFPEFKSITLMRWIRKGMEADDGSFIRLK